MGKIERRKYQISIAEEIVGMFRSGVDNVFLELPTGYGKSAIAYFVHELMQGINSDQKTIILNHQKILQDQYDEMFGDGVGLVVKGKDNYTCKLVPTIPVALAPCQYTGNCLAKGSCEYFVKRIRMMSDPLVIANYHQVFSLYDVGQTVRSTLAVYDEAHNVENIMTDYRKVVIGRDDIDSLKMIMKALNKAKFFDYENNISEIVNSIKFFNVGLPHESLKNVILLRNKLVDDLADQFFPDNDSIGYWLNKDKDFAEKLSGFLTREGHFLNKANEYVRTADSTEYIYDHIPIDDEEVSDHEFTPLEVSELFSDVAYSLSSYRLFMSGTILSEKLFSESLGIQDMENRFISMGSMFPKEDRPIFLMNVDSVNYRKIQDKDLKAITSAILSICEEHGKHNHSGYISTSSYFMAKVIVELIGHQLTQMGYKIIQNENTKDRNDAMEKFRDTSVKKRLLISPSFGEGVNFEGDICRFQIITKCPYPSLASKHVKTKMECITGWYQMETIKKIIQTSGRGIRFNGDYANTYILDSNVIRLFNDRKNFLPVWFTEAIVSEDE